MSEHREQCALFEWAARAAPRRPGLELLHAIPNAGGYTGGYRQNARRVQAMKREGVRPGVPDVCLPVPAGGFAGLYIELKAGRNKTTEAQDWWLEKLRQRGYAAAVCRGWEEARDLIEKYLDGAL
ncbi:MAG: VRR-NUC domain-containing protein [Acidobacteriota bacterium]|nr:VRR-NUC domain-containing protein [Acidobacteriota bacterium]